jgi:dUTP pyrophosphatase
MLPPLKVVRLTEDAYLPTRGKPGDAGLDLYASEEITLWTTGLPCTVRTGVKIAIPPGYVGLVWDRSGLASRYGIKTMAGVIDSSYRGEVMVVLKNLSAEIHRVNKGDRIAQLLIQEIALLNVEEVTSLEETERGDKGFGSTGL